MRGASPDMKAETQAQKLAQRALLDTIEDGLAVFGPDGRLKTHNHAFAKGKLLNSFGWGA